jgi:hypothetical protein
MDLRRLRAGEWIAGISGAALVVSLFLPWYDGRSAVDELGVGDVIVALIALGGVAAFLLTATQRVPAVPIAFEAVLTLVSVVAVVLVLVQVVSPDGGLDWGLWLALASVLGLAGGGWISVREERVAGAPPPTEIEPLPAPRP